MITKSQTLHNYYKDYEVILLKLYNNWITKTYSMTQHQWAQLTYGSLVENGYVRKEWSVENNERYFHYHITFKGLWLIHKYYNG